MSPNEDVPISDTHQVTIISQHDLFPPILGDKILPARVDTALIVNQLGGGKLGSTTEHPCATTTFQRKEMTIIIIINLKKKKKIIFLAARNFLKMIKNPPPK